MDIEQILQIPKARIKLMLAGVGGIVFFYTIFKPFQMALYDWGDYVFVNVSYALISLVVLSFHLVVFPKYFEQRYLRLISSTRGRLFFLVWVLFVIGFLFFVFKISFGYYALTWARVSTGILAFLALAFIPALCLRFLDRKQQVQAQAPATLFINERLHQVAFEDVLYVYSDKNYVVWGCLFDGVLQEFKQRETLKSVLVRCAAVEDLQQCHRAFAVNRTKVIQVEKQGNSYAITLKGYAHKIPMSRGFYQMLKETL